VANAIGLVLCGLALLVAILGYARGGKAAARVEIGEDEVEVIPIGLSKLWALKRAVTIPAAAITDVHTSDEELPNSARFGRRLLAGTYRSGGTKALLIVGRGRPVVVIECRGAPFSRVVFSTSDPEGTVGAIAAVMASPMP
jgi:hypothetical protein